ncbi:hypothetical protein [Domibacillus epiphyticus]|uniref:MarR family transcriptional regulator n=1 Tax=Domibacillus epiphyticus TaxID=1714355 RepID=A0A1V2A417_9BACI|nr:hypothetical protein [Domibacillus epiphyticus]OMP65748.1 hypothetical protein BTO28_15905 [Domibacillus epiphyticus]
MDKEKLLSRAQSMIMSSSKNPKYMTISTVKTADLFGVDPSEIDQGLNELVKEGRLKKEKMSKPPHHEVYLLP